MTTGVASDPLGLVERVIEQAVSQLMPPEALVETGDGSADDALATALGNRLARMIGGDDESEASGPHDREPAPEHVAHDHELLDRNSTLAAALGACDCWGGRPDCPICAGIGAPGWALPDEQLFAAYVLPAVRALAPAGAPHSTQADNGNGNEPRGSDSAQHMD